MSDLIDVLIVEDFAAMGECLSLYLEAKGWRCRVAGTLAEAREMLAERRPRTVVLDLGLPDGDGAQLIPEIRRAGAKVLICSAIADLHDPIELQGADRIYVKTQFTLTEMTGQLVAPRAA